MSFKEKPIPEPTKDEYKEQAWGLKQLQPIAKELSGSAAAMTAMELAEHGVEVITEAPIVVYYHGRVAGEYYADLLVANKVIVELKATKAIAPEHEAQVLNYLKATPYEVGLVLNFGPQATKKRFVYPNHRKGKMAWIAQ